jgi:hypothetical protein
MPFSLKAGQIYPDCYTEIIRFGIVIKHVDLRFAKLGVGGRGQK